MAIVEQYRAKVLKAMAAERAIRLAARLAAAEQSDAGEGAQDAKSGKEAIDRPNMSKKPEGSSCIQLQGIVLMTC